jgi:NitT/TauT family transport system substrate-binding protein
MGLAACFVFAGVSNTLAAESTLFCADWALYGKHAPYILARDKGFFKAEGIDITIRRGHGSSDTTKRVGIKDCPYGMASIGPQVIGMNKGFKNKVIGMLEHKFQQTLYYFSDSGIKKPKDFEGKRLTPGPKSSSDYAMFPVFAAANKLDLSKINWVFMSPSAKPASLGAGRVDAVISFDTQKPRFLKIAKEAGKKLQWMLWADQGMDLYSGGLLTHQDNLTGSSAKTTRGIVKAIYRGIAHSLANPDEAVKNFVKSFPEQSPKGVRDVLDIMVDHLYDGLSEKQGLGHTDLEKMRSTIKITLDAQKMPIKIKAEDSFTNEFVDALPKNIRFAKPRSPKS